MNDSLNGKCPYCKRKMRQPIKSIPNIEKVTKKKGQAQQFLLIKIQTAIAELRRGQLPVSQAAVARHLGLSPQGLYMKVQRLGLSQYLRDHVETAAHYGYRIPAPGNNVTTERVRLALRFIGPAASVREVARFLNVTQAAVKRLVVQYQMANWIHLKRELSASLEE